MNGDYESEPDWVDSLHLTDPWIASITPERISAALADFPLPFAESWNIERLTRAIQDKADLSREGPSTGPMRQSNSKARAELEKLSKLSKKLLDDIVGLSGTAERAAYWSAFGYFQSRDEAPAGSPADGYFQFSTDSFHDKLTAPLSQLATILEHATWQVGSESQTKKWRKKEAQWLRVRFAMGLTPVFEQAFGRAARANNWAAEYGEQHPWPNFYQRIYQELHSDVYQLNLGEVLQQAAQMLPVANAVRASPKEAIQSEKIS